MDRKFVILLCVVTIFSIYEVLSNNNADYNNNNKEEETKDSFKQFDEEFEEQPAYKYTNDAQKLQDDEQVPIREPTRHDTKTGFKPPINMPPIKFAFCVSCGYRQAFEQFAQMLREKYPGIEIQAGNYPPGFMRAVAAQIIGFTKIALIVCVVMGRDPFPSLGIQTPSFFQWMLSNKMSASIILFLFSNSIEGMLQSTGAFEIYIEDERIWSKLESGRVPSPPELFQAIDSHIAIRGGNKYADTLFGIDDKS